MNATTVAGDLAKSVFQLAEADDQWQIVRSHRLTRRQFERFFANRPVKTVQACTSYWAGPILRLNTVAHTCTWVISAAADSTKSSTRTWSPPISHALTRSSS